MIFLLVFVGVQFEKRVAEKQGQMRLGGSKSNFDSRLDVIENKDEGVITKKVKIEK